MKFKIGKLGRSLFWQTFIKLIATALGLFTTRWLIGHTTGSDYNSYLVVIDYAQIILAFASCISNLIDPITFIRESPARYPKTSHPSPPEFSLANVFAILF